ncbi:MAG: alpha/beta hydrolase [Candidatus Omnitrophota bacterium]
MTNFKYIDRGYKQDLVLLPGWATDCRIFDYIDLPYNYVLPVEFDISDFQSEFLSFLESNGLNKVSILGYSLGGFVAAEFAAKYADKIEALFLISIRSQYDPLQIKLIKRYINKNKKLYLQNFYKSCFSDDKVFEKYQQLLFDDYCENLGEEELLRGLDYLSAAKIEPETLNSIGNIKIIHGVLDKIAPVNESGGIADDLPNAEFLEVSNSGHMVFLEEPSILC